MRGISRNQSFILWVLFFLFASSQLVLSKTWHRRDGGKAEAELIGFDYTSKTVLLKNESHGEFTINSGNLTYESRRDVMFSPYFHGGLPDGLGKEKIYLAALVLLVPCVFFIVGLWISGMLIARVFNPLKAVLGFIGSWLVAAILIACYLVIASKSPASAKGILIVGGIFALFCSSVFVSAIYQTNTLKGLLIFVGHFLFGTVIAAGIWLALNMYADPVWLDSFMAKHVFIPTGLIPEGAPPVGDAGT